MDPAGLQGVSAGFEDRRVLGRVTEFGLGDAGEGVPSLDRVKVRWTCRCRGEGEDGPGVDEVRVAGDVRVQVRDLGPSLRVTELGLGDAGEGVASFDRVGALRRLDSGR